MTRTEEAEDRARARRMKELDNDWQPWPTSKAYTAAVRHELRGMGETPIRAVWDRAGNCRYCGEAGRCPGVHALADIAAEARRRQADKRQQTAGLDTTGDLFDQDQAPLPLFAAPTPRGAT